MSWRGAGSTRGDGNAVATPFGATATQLPAEAEKELDEAPKPQAKPDKADSKTLKKNPGILVDFKKGNEPKSTDALVPGRPDERQSFPTWISEIWNPNAAPAKGSPVPTMIAVGRVGSDRATAPSLSAAIESLPPQGGVIELRGRGPFILPAIKIANRGRVVIAAASARTGAADLSTPAPKAGHPANDQAPVIVLVPVAGTSVESRSRRH